MAALPNVTVIITVTFGGYPQYSSGDITIKWPTGSKNYNGVISGSQISGDFSLAPGTPVAVGLTTNRFYPDKPGGKTAPAPIDSNASANGTTLPGPINFPGGTSTSVRLGLVTATGATGAGGGTSQGSGQQGGGSTSPTAGCTQPSNPLDYGGWISYLGCVLGNIWTAFIAAINTAWSAILTAIWNALPPWVQNGLQWYVRTVNWLIKIAELAGSQVWAALQAIFSGNPSAIPQPVLDEWGKIFASITNFIGGLDASPIQTWFAGIIHDWYTNYQPRVNTILTTPQASPSASRDAIEKIIEDYTSESLSVQLPFELIPFIGLQVFTQLFSTAVSLLGIDKLAGLVEGYLGDAGLGELTRQQVNALYQNKLPDQASLARLRNLGTITDQQYQHYAQAQTGMNSNVLEDLRTMGFEVPNLEDIFTYNRRYPNSPVDPASLEDLLGVKYAEYVKYLQERQYSGVSERFIQAAFDILDFNETQIRRLLTLAGVDPRPDQILAMSPQDIYVKVIQNRKGLTEGMKAVSALTQNYIHGIVTRAQLLTLVQQVFASVEAQNYAMQYADAELAKYQATGKHFTYSQMIAYAKAGVDVTDFIDSDLAYYRWDAGHIKAVKEYIRKELEKAKLPKQIRGTTTVLPS